MNDKQKTPDIEILPGTTEVVEYNPALAEENIKNNGPFTQDGGKGVDS